MVRQLASLFLRVRTAAREVRLLTNQLGFRRGLWAKAKSALVERFSPPGMVYGMPWPGLDGTVWIRNGSSDIQVYKQLVLRRELDFSLDFEPLSVLDGGANIGLAAVSFALAFPNAIIVCVEPEEHNVQILRKNVEAFGDRVRVFQGAIWHRSCLLRIDNPRSDSWAFQVVEDPDGPITAFCVQDLAASARVAGGFDLVKLDIEGAEREVFSGDTSWTDDAKTIAVELHDWLIPGAGTPVLKVLTEPLWRRVDVGEYSIFSRRTENLAHT